MARTRPSDHQPLGNRRCTFQQRMWRPITAGARAVDDRQAYVSGSRRMTMLPGHRTLAVLPPGGESEISFLHRCIQARIGIAARRCIPAHMGIAGHRHTLFAPQLPGSRRRSRRRGKQHSCMWIGWRYSWRLSFQLKRDASVGPLIASSLNETAKSRLDALDADSGRRHAEHALEGTGEMSGVREATGIGSLSQVVACCIRSHGEFKAQP